MTSKHRLSPFTLTAATALATLALSAIAPLHAQDGAKPSTQATAQAAADAANAAPAAPQPVFPEEKKTIQFGDNRDGIVRNGKPIGKGWKSLFDGKTLDGWVYEPGYWSVVDGAIVGDKKGATPHHHYMFSDKDYSDFEMHIDFKMTGYNSGVCARIHPVTFDDVPGYQVDEGQGYFGCLWDEHHRQKKIIDYPADKAKAIMSADGWNHYYFRMVGHHVTIFLNGVKTGEIEDEGGYLDGPLGFQLCHGDNTIASFRNIYVKPLVAPTKGTAPAVPATVVP
jgi:hypothetical protein